MSALAGILRGIWRLIQPLRSVSPRAWGRYPALYARYFREWRQYRALGGRADFELLAPTLRDRDPNTQSGGGNLHYFLQDVWALRQMSARLPTVHHDVGSRLDGFVGQATALCPIVYWDIRPPAFTLPDLEFRAGDILHLPLADQSIDSLSCLHVAEHIGLGRYGDAINPLGFEQALRELMRVLAPGGRLLFSTPVGAARICFNAQRISPPDLPVEIMTGLRLVTFAAVDDAGELRCEIAPAAMAAASYACGLYVFEKPVL